MTVRVDARREAFVEALSEGGMLDFNGEGVAGCVRCGWRGVPTFVAGVRSTRCPVCETGPETDREYAAAGPRRVVKVGRNDPCPCGSGRKAKKCGCGALA